MFEVLLQDQGYTSDLQQTYEQNNDFEIQFKHKQTHLQEMVKMSMSVCDIAHDHKARVQSLPEW